jgi:hypothetical protein
MIVAALSLPQAPILLPGLTGGPVAEVDTIRAAIDEGVKAALATDPDEVVVVGRAPETRTYAPGAPSPAGRLAPAPDRRPAASSLPLSLAVGREVLVGQGAGDSTLTLQGVDGVAPVAVCRDLGARLAARPGRLLLLVAGDGSARRGEKAPGHLDPRAAGFDATVAASLVAADTEALLALAPELCEDLLVAGRAAWQVMAGACAGETWRTHRYYAGDPFGVAYHVVLWSLPSPMRT